jgi:hypothetical protein
MSWLDAARYAPLATAGVALLALVIAVASIVTQRRIARRRAAIDFFLKTEMDEKMVSAFEALEDSIRALQQAPSMQEFSRTSECKKIRAYLSIHELMAVGIHNNTFDQRICYDFWSDVLTRCYNDAATYIQYRRTEPGCAQAYDDLIRLHKRWNGPHWIWQSWRSRWWPLQF